ncbi:hypothetical protein AtDm6_0123 [Acetobacter tropicalis]|uniref:Uncharacterized protein n=1 Tax=Acetobacter tropicalis TaxID=104102 RepID=A0A094YYL6_9PROT|nr:hypothetical protein AtDm6_0123 [Acetobacter tropicalis]
MIFIFLIFVTRLLPPFFVKTSSEGFKKQSDRLYHPLT